MILEDEEANQSHVATQCTAAFAAVPFCADNSWSLWDAADEAAQENEQSGYFCCLPGQVGLQTGDCVDSNTEVPASLSASLVCIPTSDFILLN